MIAQVEPDALRDVFLCHSKVDADWVRALASRIEQETWNGRTLRVAFDEWDVRPGDNVVKRISDLLEQSRHVAIILTPELLGSDFATLEWTSAVNDDPGGIHRRVMPLFLRDTDLGGSARIRIPTLLRVFSWIDFRKKARFETEYRRLIAHLRDEPMPRGSNTRTLPATLQGPARLIPAPSPAGPDSVAEIILSNLLPVTAYPPTVWSARTGLRRERDLWKAVQDPAARRTLPPVILKESRIFALADLTTHRGPLAQHFDAATVRADSASVWRKQPDQWRWYVELLNKTLVCFARFALRLRADHDGAETILFYPALKSGGDALADRVEPFVGSKRTVAKRCVRPDGSAFWIHHGARIRVETLSNALYLRIVPCWVLTRDGLEIQRGPDVGPLTAKWSGKERNAAILRNVLFWAHVLARGSPQIDVPTGGAALVIQRDPTLTKTTSGIAGDFVRIAALLSGGADELDRAAVFMSSTTTEAGDEDD